MMNTSRTEQHLSDVLRMLMAKSGIQSDNELTDRLEAFENGQSGPAISQPTISRILNGSTRVPAGLQCDKQADVPAMQQLARAYSRFEETRSAAASIPRAGIGSALLELMRARDAVVAVAAQSPCAQAIKAAAAKRAELSYLSIKTFAAGDNLEHLYIETAATYAGIHYTKGRQLYGF